jgi:outer membrane protein, heavy metal efflux system
MSVRRLFWIGTFLFATGCAGTAGSGAYDAGRLRFDRAEPRARVQGSGDRPARSIDGPVLERAAFVRAVLIESARQGWRAALARVRQAGVFDDPMVDLGVAPLSIGSSRARFGYELQVSQRLPWFGKRSLDASVASAEAAVARSDFEATRRELALMASTLYDQYYVAERSLRITKVHADLVGVLRASATAQFESGRGSAEEPLAAEAELASMERDLAVLGVERDVTAAQMNELLHRAPGERLPAPPAELPHVSLPEMGDAKRLESDAVSARPDVVAVRQRARVEGARAERAEREYYPDFTVSTSYNSMWDMPEHRWMVGLGFNVPVFTGRRAGAAEEAAAMKKQYESDAARLEATARTEVYVAVRRLDESRRVLELFETRLLPVARQRIDAARAGFITSRTSFTAVIEAERNLRRVELDYETSRADWSRRRGELERALGRIPGMGGEGAGR